MSFYDVVFRDANGSTVEYDGSGVSWRVSVYAVVIQDSKILLVKNKQEKMFDLPGGGLRMDESIGEALTREVREEAGAEIAIGPVVTYSQDYFFHKARFYRTLLLFFWAELNGPLGKPTDQNMETARFVAFEEIERLPLLDYVREVITNNFEGGKK